MFQPQIALSLFNWLLYQSILPFMWMQYLSNNASVTVIIALLTALLEYLDLVNGIAQSAIFLLLKFYYHLKMPA